MFWSIPTVSRNYSMSLNIAIEIAREAGALLRDFQDRLTKEDIAQKTSRRDLVTKADFEAERLIVARIRKHFPDHAIFAEEEVKETAVGDRPLWLVDPLDGTINFIHGHPHYAVSLGLYRSGVPLLGVVYNPAIEELFAAQTGQGATRNGQPIHVSVQTELDQSLLSTGFPYRRQELPNNNLENFNRLFLQVRGIRRLGVASLDLAYVACARFDGFWELHLQPYDVAAGAVLVREAGGLVSDFVMGESWLQTGEIIASNGRIHGAIRDRLIR